MTDARPADEILRCRRCGAEAKILRYGGQLVIRHVDPVKDTHPVRI